MESLDWQFAGLPLHPLFVHAAVVLVPLAALMVVATAVWPAAARKLTFLTPLTALVAGAFALLAHVSGEWLEPRVADSADLATHLGYAELMNPMAMLLVVSSGLLWVWQRVGRPRLTERRRLVLWVDVAAAVIAIGAMAAVVAAVVLTGDSGARAVWG